MENQDNMQNNEQTTSDVVAELREQYEARLAEQSANYEARLAEQREVIKGLMNGKQEEKKPEEKSEMQKEIDKINKKRER